MIGSSVLGDKTLSKKVNHWSTRELTDRQIIKEALIMIWSGVSKKKTSKQLNIKFL